MIAAVDLSTRDMLRARFLGDSAARWGARQSAESLADDLDLEPIEVRHALERLRSALEGADRAWNAARAQLVIESPITRAWICSGSPMHHGVTE